MLNRIICCVIFAASVSGCATGTWRFDNQEYASEAEWVAAYQARFKSDLATLERSEKPLSTKKLVVYIPSDSFWYQKAAIVDSATFKRTITEQDARKTPINVFVISLWVNIAEQFIASNIYTSGEIIRYDSQIEPKPSPLTDIVLYHLGDTPTQQGFLFFGEKTGRQPMFEDRTLRDLSARNKSLINQLKSNALVNKP